MNISSRDRIWSDGVKLDFRMCKFKWKNLIFVANGGYLNFMLIFMFFVLK
ncbi:hypothetical protein [Borrelia turicatae]|uniref:Transmembrane protein n=1 Tax=Borrelia turicatae (strain 91E135) TaxID=314724 RepID=A0A0R9P7T0_BORT9|nr:hypothetical protein [Borrelia turicatae]ALC78596.1 hypothetical protein BTA082a [Borrelia turicatae 91E135]UPA14010.1 hypothetical protein bt91E135_001174 [Borrelia turicatae 91E135]UPA15502.1 hypothetical protein btBTE5EL_001184 [Borrelia turicatae]